MERKLLLIMLKYLPVVMMLFAIVNNIIILSNGSLMFNNLMATLFGNSLIFSVVMILCSYLFLYCIWQRVIVYANLILIMFSFYWDLSGLGCDFLYYYVGSYIIIAIGVLVALFLHLYKRSHRNNKLRIVRSEKSSKRNERLIYFIVKWLPLYSMLLLMLNNLMSYFECDRELYDYSFGYLFGNSFVFSILIFMLSRVLKIGKWNRVLIIVNALVLTFGIYYVYVDFFEYEEIPDAVIASIMYVIQISGLIVSLGLAVKSHAKKSTMSLKLSD